MFKSLMYFELIFMCGVRYETSSILVHLAIQFSQPYLLKRLYSPHCIFLPPLSPIGHTGMSLFLDYFYNSLIYVPVFAQCRTVSLLQLCSILWNQETWCLQLYSSSCTRLLWLFGIFCGSIQILGFLIYVKKCHWILIKTALTWDKRSDLVHWEDLEGSGGEEGGRGDRDGEHM